MRACPFRSEAIRLGKTTYENGRPCKHGHVGPRLTVNSTCTICAAAITAKAKTKGKERAKHTNALYYTKNKATICEQNRVWREENDERMREMRRAHYEANKPRYMAASAKRRAARIAGTPPWVDISAIAAIYAEAKRLTVETGIPHDVDHIIPLQGDGVCGLHVPWNLRPMPAAANRAKQNRL